MKNRTDLNSESMNKKRIWQPTIGLVSVVDFLTELNVAIVQEKVRLARSTFLGGRFRLRFFGLCLA